MIEIRGLFGNWTEVDKEQAKRYVAFLKDRITNISREKINEYINKNRLRGITVEELEK